MKEAIEQVRHMMGEATDHHNDGYVMAGYKKELKRIYELIGNFLFADAKDLNAGEYIYESPDGGKTIYRRKSGDYENKELVS